MRTFLAFLFAGVLAGLLTMGAGRLVGETPASSEDLEGYCVGVQVGSSHAADAHLHIQNRGPNTARVRFDWRNVDGVAPATTDTRFGLAPGAAETIVFRTPALGAAVWFRSFMPNLYANAVIHRDDGADLETRDATLCLGGSDPF